MQPFASLNTGLSFLGAHATRVLFLGIFLGIALPPLASLARPLLAPAVVLLLSATLLRVDWSAMREYARRPVLATLLTAWLLLGAPVISWLLLSRLVLPESLTTAIVLMAAAPPILSAAAIAVLLDLDGALAVVAGLISTLLTPLTVPPLALALLGIALDISMFDFMLRLGGIVVVAFLAALAIRHVAPPGWLHAHRSGIDGVVVILMLLFAVAIMDGVTETAIARPGMVALWVLAAFVANPVLQLLGMAAFSWLGRRGALTVGLISGNCNMGLLLASLPPAADFDVLLFFALAQLPIFMLPAMMLPVYRRLLPETAAPELRD